MARHVFKLPDVGEGTAEAEIVAWHVAPGDRVAEDQTLVDVMTDKATVEIPSPVAGTVLSINGEPGAMLAVGSELVVLEVEGTGDRTDAAAPADAPGDAPGAPVAAASPASATATAVAAVLAGEPAPEPAATAPDPTAPALLVRRPPGTKPTASPAVRRRAWDLGIPLQFVTGSGPGGRILHRDLDRHLADGAETGGVAVAERPPPLARTGVSEVPVRGLRRRIAESMQEAKRHIPHFSYIEEVDVTALEELRLHVNSGGQDADGAVARPKLTLLPFLIRALVRVLPDFPQINARYDDAANVVHRFEAVHAGIATQTPGGLVVPVVRHAEALDLWQAADAVRRLAAAARDGQATREQLSGSTITITSLGALGGLATTPIINRPEVAIVGINRIVERPVVRRGNIVVRSMMNLSCSFDHRVVDGWDAASFVQRVKNLLEQPATLFMEPPR
ncbi:dihydrolipoamide acetyltransferase family protein [Azospirillum picis]|uniref:Dihydrolipoamide acetyltransferase component of pyruvate dehydrogenase complex n=1 Tax=Azospirillum picis TaxID=488438 RepID=A0ABU0MSP1_9PROT|nr:dihydrolipoamide acetyltransferase family protein [Azospirillum picis]MBP2302731.1 2-oxoisovalerate dehydrogenase E2 component (dihydrolipoyl transacylase) [Azospirillum picis]MDQ0536482.1 2-oxoisovalerate dehydrogenase E2 component (dihydrolipoyl transacylase) [Azospirillum picis]